MRFAALCVSFLAVLGVVPAAVFAASSGRALDVGAVADSRSGPLPNLRVALEGETDAAAPKTLASVVLVGASVTAGFQAKLDVEVEGTTATVGLPLNRFFEAADRSGAGTFTAYGDVLFFGSPQTRGPKQLAKARELEPSLLVGVDFLFWFGYGQNDHEGRKVTDPAQRYAKLEYGLAMLEEFECPIVLGDFPDMSGAIGTMLMPSMVPDLETLAVLNGMLYEWAEARDNVVVVPLAATFTRMQADEDIEVAGYVWPAGSRASLLHKDRLHTTFEGTVAIVQLIAAALDETDVLDAEALELSPEVLRERTTAAAVERTRERLERRKRKTTEAKANAGG